MPFDKRYRRYLLGVLLVIQAFNYVDRQALGLVLQDIKVDLSLSDTQLGLMTGIAFASFYSLMGMPIARWADRGNRVTLIALSTAAWSFAVMSCAAVRNFTQLLLTRMAVAVGEAGCMPPANSLIPDYYDRAERPQAMAIYMLGSPLSALIGYLVAGQLNVFVGWRMTFVVLGAPGIALALLSGITLKEPRRRQDNNDVAATPSSREVVVALWSNVTFRHLLLCYSVSCFFDYGIGQWQPSFFIRTFGLDTGRLGVLFALIYGGGGLLGAYLGGAWASRYAAANESLQLRAMAGIYGGFGLLSAAIYLSPRPQWSFVCLALTALGGMTIYGPLFATIQTLVPARMRAISIAILYLVANLIGMGLGPLAVGALSDALEPTVGTQSLRYALAALSPGYFWCVWHLLEASKTVKTDVSRTLQRV